MSNDGTRRYKSVTCIVALLCCLPASAITMRYRAAGGKTPSYTSTSSPGDNPLSDDARDAGWQSSDREPAFRLSAPKPATLRLLPGQASMVTLSLSANTAFNGRVALTCSGATVGIECLVSPASMTLAQGQTIPATVAVATQGPSATVARSHAAFWTRAAGVLSLSGVLFVLTFRRRRLPRGLWAALFVAALGIGADSLTGCSGASSKPKPTPVGKTNLIITATSGSMIQQQTLPVSITQN